MSFSVISHLFLFQWVSKVSLFDNLAPNARPKNTIKIGVSATHFWKTDMRHETASSFGPKKTQNQKFQSSFVWAFFFSFNKKHKNPLKPLFFVFWQT